MAPTILAAYVRMPMYADAETLEEQRAAIVARAAELGARVNSRREDADRAAARKRTALDDAFNDLDEGRVAGIIVSSLEVLAPAPRPSTWPPTRSRRGGGW